MYKYLKTLSQYSSFRFIAEVSALSLISRYIVVMPVLIVLAILGIDVGTPNMELYKQGREPLGLFIELCLFGPLIETWLLQWLPLKILKFFRLHDTLRITLASLLFASLHLSTGGLVNLIGTIPIGFLLNWAFVIQEKKRGLWKTSWIVFAIHALTNLFPFIIYLLDMV